MQLLGHSVWIDGSQGRELYIKEKKLAKENKKGSWVILLGNVVHLLVARLWLYMEHRHKTLVGRERKEGAKENKKIGSDGNSRTRDHLDVLYVGRGI